MGKLALGGEQWNPKGRLGKSSFVIHPQKHSNLGANICLKTYYPSITHASINTCSLALNANILIQLSRCPLERCSVFGICKNQAIVDNRAPPEESLWLIISMIDQLFWGFPKKRKIPAQLRQHCSFTWWEVGVLCSLEGKNVHPPSACFFSKPLHKGGRKEERREESLEGGCERGRRPVIWALTSPQFSLSVLFLFSVSFFFYFFFRKIGWKWILLKRK